MKNFLTLALLLGFATTASAGQIVQSAHVKDSSSPPFGARSDGVVFETTHKTPRFAENGSVGVKPAGFHMDFTTQGDDKEIVCLQDDGTAYDTTTLLLNRCDTSLGFTFNVFNLGTQTTAPDMDAASLDIGGAQTDDIGMELWAAGFEASQRPFVVGRDGAFYTCATFALEQVEGTDDFHVGFKAIAVPNATHGSLANYVELGWNGNADPQDLELEYDLATSETIVDAGSHTITDATSTKLCVGLSATGVVSAEINDASVDVGTVTMTDGLIMTPYIYTIHDASLAGEIDLYTWSAGFGEIP